MFVIDFHTHPYTCGDGCLCVYPDTVPPDPEGMREQLIKCGITTICGSPLYRDGRFDLKGLNDTALSLRDRLGDFYVPGMHVHPADPDASVREVDRMHALGVRLIGELVPYMHGWGDDRGGRWDEALRTILDRAARYRMCVSFHTMWDWPADDIIADYPDVTFVAAHPGERESVERHIRRMRRFDNVCLDLSGTGIFRFGCIRHLIRSVGAERILFGTDYPICNPLMYVHAVLGEDLGEDAEERIFSGNARRVLGL